MVGSSTVDARSVGEVVEAWCDGGITTPQALVLGDFDDYAELLDFAIRSGTPLRTALTKDEEAQAAFLTDIMTSR